MLRFGFFFFVVVVVLFCSIYSLSFFGFCSFVAGLFALSLLPFTLC